MIDDAWTKLERDMVVQRYLRALAEADAALERDDEGAAERAGASADAAEAEYLARLPRVPMSTCPFDGKPLVRAFDPFGLDGMWWTEEAKPQEPPACPHFALLVGSVAYEGKPPYAGAFEVYPGPEVPYVLPRILGMPDVVAVIGELPMVNGYRAYPIAYFAVRRPPPQDLAASWKQTHFSWETQLGEAGSRLENDRWDFDLRPWLEQGRLRWTVPGSRNLALSDESWDRCPHLAARGERKKVVVSGARVSRRAPPDGRYISPYDD